MTAWWERVERAERAAAGACEHLMGYVRATDEFMKVWADDDTTIEAKSAALDGLRLAHNAALDWDLRTLKALGPDIFVAEAFCEAEEAQAGLVLSNDDAEFIAASRTFVSELLSEVRRNREKIAKIEALVADTAISWASYRAIRDILEPLS